MGLIRVGKKGTLVERLYERNPNQVPPLPDNYLASQQERPWHLVEIAIRNSRWPEIHSLFACREMFKEVSESMAVVHAVGNLDLDRRDRDLKVLVIGDGTKPRTAGLMSIFSNWKVHSLDPIMKQGLDTPNTVSHTMGVEQWQEEMDLVIGVHAHATWEQTCHAIGKYSVWLPCCKSWVPKNSYEIASYSDLGCLSEKRTIFVHKKLA